MIERLCATVTFEESGYSYGEPTQVDILSVRKNSAKGVSIAFRSGVNTRAVIELSDGAAGTLASLLSIITEGRSASVEAEI